jgi:hypothetical protein
MFLSEVFGRTGYTCGKYVIWIEFKFINRLLVTKDRVEETHAFAENKVAVPFDEKQNAHSLCKQPLLPARPPQKARIRVLSVESIPMDQLT